MMDAFTHSTPSTRKSLLHVPQTNEIFTPFVILGLLFEKLDDADDTPDGVEDQPTSVSSGDAGGKAKKGKGTGKKAPAGRGKGKKKTDSVVPVAKGVSHLLNSAVSVFHRGNG
jgi:hypothetical protein